VQSGKFPSGLDALADKVAEKGVRLGVWVEPEMVSRG
jgi:alpha-galactosidase